MLTEKSNMLMFINYASMCEETDTLKKIAFSM